MMFFHHENPHEATNGFVKAVTLQIFSKFSNVKFSPHCVPIFVLVDQKKNEFDHGNTYDEQRWGPTLTMFSIGNSFEVSHEGFIKGNVLVQAFVHDKI